MEELLLEQHGAVAMLTLNRPAKRNALSIELRRALTEQLAALGEDPAVAVVVLTGAPPAFCAGMDRTQFGGDAEHKRAIYESSTAVLAALLHLPVPAIAAVGGPALGGGFVLAALCDLRIASPSATFGHPEVAMGIPASYGALIRILPEQLARDLAYTGRTVDASEARSLGIVGEVVDAPVERALSLGETMAAHGRELLVATKRMITDAHADGPSARAFETEGSLFHQALFGANQAMEGKRHFQQKAP